MRKLLCKTTGKGIWLDNAMLAKIKTLLLLKAPAKIIMPPVHSNHIGNYWINFGGMRLYARYFGNNQWGFMTLPQGFMNATPNWNQHPLYSDWFKQEVERIGNKIQ